MIKLIFHQTGKFIIEIPAKMEGKGGGIMQDINRHKAGSLIPRDDNTALRAHELLTIYSLVRAGYDVEILPIKYGDHVKSPDIQMNGVEWEMKAPKSNNPKRIERRIRDAVKQSQNVIFDSHRMSNLPDHIIKRHLMKCACAVRTLKRLIFVNKKHEVEVIK